MRTALTILGVLLALLVGYRWGYYDQEERINALQKLHDHIIMGEKNLSPLKPEIKPRVSGI